MPPFEPVEIRFWKHVNKCGANGCWEWTGSANNKGYGRINIGGKVVLAHRVSYTLAYGSIPDGLLVCHKCDNPTCVNPSHLFAGTYSDNRCDAISKGRWTYKWHPRPKVSRPQTPETRAKISATLKQHKRTAEHCRNISASAMGHPVSEETRRKISEKLRGRKIGRKS